LLGEKIITKRNITSFTSYKLQIFSKERHARCYNSIREIDKLRKIYIIIIYNTGKDAKKATEIG